MLHNRKASASRVNAAASSSQAAAASSSQAAAAGSSQASVHPFEYGDGQNNEDNYDDDNTN